MDFRPWNTLEPARDIEREKKHKDKKSEVTLENNKTSVNGSSVEKKMGVGLGESLQLTEKNLEKVELFFEVN